MVSITVRNFLMCDLDQLTNFFRQNMLNPKHKTQTPQRIVRNLYLHSILNVPSSLGLEIFIGSVAVVDEKKIVGVIIARRFPLGKSWIVGPVVVHREFRRSQIATRLMNNLIKKLKKKKARSAISSVERSNYKGRSFFEKFGFNYLDHSFTNHGKARHYARKFALVTSYLPYFWHNICRIYPIDRNQNYRKLGIRNNSRIWYILEKKL